MSDKSKMVVFVVLSAQQHFFNIKGLDYVLNPGKDVALPEDNEYVNSLIDQGMIKRKEVEAPKTENINAPEGGEGGNTGGENAPPTPPTPPVDYSALGFEELKALAAERGIDTTGLTSKAMIREKLVEDDNKPKQ